ncbi:MAG: fibronectin type III domain-containing protein [Acidimicrobiales bacterium]
MTRLCQEGVDPVDTVRPSVPGRPQLQSLGVDSASFVWTSSTDNVAVVGYRIYANSIDGVASGAVLYDGPANSAGLTDLAPGTYEIYTKAYDAAGNESYRSGFTTFTVTGAVVDLERPSTPTGLVVALPAANTADLSWNASTDNVGVVGYRVFDASGALVATFATNSGTFTGLDAGTYDFYVKAYDAAGNQSWRSNIVTFTIA